MIRYRTLAIPLTAAVVVSVVHFAPKPSQDRRPPNGVEVTQAAYACPTGSGITVGAGQVIKGTEGTATVLPDKSADDALAGATTWRTSRVDGNGVVVEQQGEGSGPVGFFGARAAKDDGAGLSVGSCSSGVDDGWFLGLGSGSKHFSTVILTNGASAPAAVDLELWGPKGKIDAVGATGVVIKPFTTRRVPLADLAAGEPDIALRVLRRRGSVTAVVNDQSTAVFSGTEPVGPTATPRRSQVIGGLVAGTSGRTLMILNPGTNTARIEVSVIGPENTFKPSGLEAVKVKAGTVQLMEIPSSTGGDRQSLQITSDVPVAATVRMAPNESDYAYAESVPALAGPAVVPVDLGEGVNAPDLILSAPDKDASVEVLAFDKNMEQLDEASLKIDGGTTQHLDAATAFKAKGIAYLVVRAKGEVLGAATYRDGARISSLALVSAPINVLAPQVRPVD